MTAAELDALEKLANAANEGPWIYGPDSSTLKIVMQESTAIPIARAFQNGDDPAFIAAARTAIPALIAEVRRLEEKVEELTSHYQEQSGGD